MKKLTRKLQRNIRSSIHWVRQTFWAIKRMHEWNSDIMSARADVTDYTNHYASLSADLESLKQTISKLKYDMHELQDSRSDFEDRINSIENDYLTEDNVSEHIDTDDIATDVESEVFRRISEIFSKAC